MGSDELAFPPTPRGVGFFGQAIEPLRRPFFGNFACSFHVSLGRRLQAKLVDTFTLLLMGVPALIPPHYHVLG